MPGLQCASLTKRATIKAKFHKSIYHLAEWGLECITTATKSFLSNINKKHLEFEGNILGLHALH